MNYFNERNEVVENYALALFEVLKENGHNGDEIINDLNMFQLALRGNETKELKRILYYPLISVEKKVEYLHEIFDRSLNKLVVDFIITITEEQRITFLPLIIEELILANNLDKNIINVKATFGIEPSKEDVQKIIKKLESKLECSSIDFEYIVDETLIGGVQLFYNGRYIDNTLLSKINRFAEQIKS